MKNKASLQYWLFIIFLCGIIFTSGAALAQDSKIFILHSYHQEYSWTHSENEGFTHTLTNKFPDGNISFSTEYLDTKRVAFNKEYQEFFFQYLKHKYNNYSPDVIFCSDDNALTFLLQFKERLFGNVPVVFCGVNNLGVEKDLNRQQYAGVFEKKEIIPNLNLLTKINSLPDKIIILGDDSPTYQAIKQTLKKDLASQNPKFKYIFLASNDHSYLIKHLKSQEKGVVLLTTIGGIKDENEYVIPLQKTIASIVRAGNFTIMIMEDAYMGEGVFGGYVTNGVSQGKNAADLAKQILDGVSPSQIPLVKESPNVFMFNYPELKSHGINLSQLPEKSIILNKPESFYDQHKFLIWSVLSFLIFQTLIIFSLIKNVRKRRNAESSLQTTLDLQEQKIVERTSKLADTNTDLKKEIIEKKEAQETAQRFNRVFEHSLNEIYIFDTKTFHFIKVNRGAQNNLGYTMEELSHLTAVDLKPEFSLQSFGMTIEPLLAGTQEKLVFSTVHQRKNGTRYPVEVHLQLMTIGAPVFVAIILDITERKQAEAERVRLESDLQQAQKMESIGNLAGGIAHEFNNLLAIIMGNNELIIEELPQGSLARESTEDIRIAGIRARDVVKQLLTFSRQDDAVKKVMDFTSVVQESMKLIRTSTPVNIKIEQNLSADTYPVMGNNTQVNQLLINLCNNAVDALPEKGGIITIELLNETIDIKQTKHQTKLKSGQYAKLIVSDNGIGMDTEILDRVFEPYFTTKAFGEGTGIGMAVVHGIVERHGGAIIADSKPGQGTTFTIFLPAHEGLFEQETEERDILPVGDEYILYVDDEPSIATLGKRLLEGLGYTTESTTDPKKALDMVRNDPNKFDLLITDMAMPNMTGEQLVIETLKIRQNMPIIICTGYSAKISEKEAADIGVRSFVMKPINKSELAKMVRKVLDGAKKSDLVKP
jgi:PAS domain S-box-containing protein